MNKPLVSTFATRISRNFQLSKLAHGLSSLFWNNDEPLTDRHLLEILDPDISGSLLQESHGLEYAEQVARLKCYKSIAKCYKKSIEMQRNHLLRHYCTAPYHASFLGGNEANGGGQDTRLGIRPGQSLRHSPLSSLSASTC